MKFPVVALCAVVAPPTVRAVRPRMPAAPAPAARRAVRPRMMVDTATASTELMELLADGRRTAKGPYPSARERTPEQLEQIRSLIEGLEHAGQGVRYLDGEKFIAQWRLGAGVGKDRESEALYDSYEVAFFDGSVDGGGSSGGRSNTTAASRGLRSRVLRALFSLRFSLQHVRAPNVAVNDVGFSFCGLPASVITKASFTRLNASAVVLDCGARQCEA